MPTDKVLTILAVTKSSVENLNETATELLATAKRSRALSKAYKKSIGDISLASIACLTHLYNLEEEIKHLEISRSK